MTSKKTTEIVKKESTIEQKVHRCMSWPFLAEERDLDEKTGELLHDSILIELLKYGKDTSIDYAYNYESSVNFVKNFKIPSNIKVIVNNAAGCVVCYHALIPLEVHYLMIKGYCDLKTIQYYLFNKGIFYKSWYLKKHLKHIKVIPFTEPVDLSTLPDDNTIIRYQINSLIMQIKKLEELDEVGNDNLLLNCRSQLTHLIESKSKLIDESNDEIEKIEISFTDPDKKEKNNDEIEELNVEVEETPTISEDNLQLEENKGL